MTTSVIGLVLVVAAMGVESFAQLFLKLGALGAQPASVRSVVRLPQLTPSAWIGFGVAAYVIEIFLYTEALRYLDVSVAFPLGSLCFVGVAVLSRLVLGESLGRMRLLGIGLILIGAALVAG